ncbi:hypothetical protein Aperf_G00000028126 [Anoplocephala perfoliata]
MLALKARYLRISRPCNNSESVVSTEMFEKLQNQVEKDLMITECCLQAMDALSEEKNRIRSEKLFDFSDSENQFSDTDVMANQSSNERASKNSKIFSSNTEVPQSMIENAKVDLKQPSAPVSLATSEFLHYQLLTKESASGAPPFEIIEKYFQKMDGVEKVYSLPPGNAGCIVFKSMAHAQTVLSSGNHAVNGCKIKLFAVKQLPKSLRKKESKISKASNPPSSFSSLVGIQPSMLSTTSRSTPFPLILPRTSNWISFEVMVMESMVHPLWLQTIYMYFLRYGKVVSILKNLKGISGYVAFSSESEALRVVSSPMHSVMGFPMRVALFVINK